MRNNRPDVLVHANAIVRLFDGGVRMATGAVMERDKTYEITREAWIAAVYLLALQIITGQHWWLLVTPEENSEKDSIGFCPTEVDQNRTNLEQIPIQVFVRPDSSANTILESIIKKLQKHDLSNVSLVCYSNKSETINLIDINKKLSQLPFKPKVRDVWIIGNKVGFPRKKDVVLVYPDLGRFIEIDLDKDYQESKPTFIQPFRGKRKGPMFEPMHKPILLKPDFVFEDL